MPHQQPLFEFLRYTNPGWYFNLRAEGDIPYFLDVLNLPEEERATLVWDNRYQQAGSAARDAAYQALMQGVIKTSTYPQLDLRDKPTRADNYRFIRKYYHAWWSWYILFLRLCMFYNPLSELYAFLRTMQVKRTPLNHQAKLHTGFDHFDSPLVRRNPKVSVIIPTLNRYPWLKDALHDLEQQSYKNFEVLVIDQSDQANESFYRNFNLDLRFIRQPQRGLWRARNRAVKESQSDYLLFFDDDSRVQPDWIEQHLRCLDYFNADLSSGVSLSAIGAKVPQHYAHFRWSDQVDTGNVLIHRSVFERTGLFDLQFEGQRQGDGEFGLRCYLFGFKNINNPFAGRIHLKVSGGGLREMGSWTGFKPKSLLAPRPIPSVLYYHRRYFGNRAAVFLMFLGVPPSFLSYRRKRSKYYLALGFIAFPITLPLVLFATLRSWYLSDYMIRKGPQIENLQP